MIKFFDWKLSEWIRDRFERTLRDQNLRDEIPLVKKRALLITRTGSFSKNVIIPEAAMFSKV